MFVNDKYRLGYIVFTVIIFCFLLLIGPLDYFNHGFYCNPPYWDSNLEYVQYTDFDKQDFEQKFVPVKEHFRGVELFFSGIDKDAYGRIIVTIQDENGEIKDKQSIELGKLSNEKWYPVYVEGNLKKGSEYTLKVGLEECTGTPALLLANELDMPLEHVLADTNEKQSSGALLGYGYAESTFSLSEKFLMSALMICIWMTVGLRCVNGKKSIKLKVKNIIIVIMGIGILTWTYIYNSFDAANQNSFSGFQSDSERLAAGPIVTEHDNVTLEKYGLGTYKTIGYFDNYTDEEFLTDDDFTEGYSLYEAVIAVHNNSYTDDTIVTGNMLQFQDGSMYTIRDVIVVDTYIYAYLETDELLSRGKNGSLEHMRVFRADGAPLQIGRIVPYESQYGLQGKMFRHLARRMEFENVISNLNFLCSLLTSVVFVWISVLVSKKYNILLGICFYITFWLSPWIVNFARNLYWVEFTWFLPMLVGLICSLYLENARIRRGCYAAAFLTILIKSLCGYEYISTIMMGLIMFLIVDIMLALLAKNNKTFWLLAKTILCIGIMAILGFLCALCIHAELRGEGNILAGIKSIWDEDVLRRTVGGRLDEFSQSYWDSLNASVWTVVCKYFRFHTEVIIGIAGNLFPLMTIAPLMITVWNYKCHKAEWNDMIFYVAALITSISWYILGKSHSYFHTHINFVLWYFGFVQICLYIIVKQIICWVGARHRTEGEKSEKKI